MSLKVIAGHQTSSNAIDMYHNKALPGRTMAWKEMAHTGQKNVETRTYTSLRCNTTLQIFFEYYFVRLFFCPFVLLSFHPCVFLFFLFFYPVYNKYYTLYIVHYTLYTVHYILYTIHYTTLYTIHYILHTIHYTLYSVHCALYTLHYTLYTLQNTLYTIHYTL